ncbi:MAG TPA: aminoacetone oxidase family FAD-binding enzyme [Ruminococcaceae bacterium]|nr:aminoacetone oxidase family FAD-binding enzyme [Oscillospiraceae bacterium]
MAKKCDVLVVGAGAAGMLCAAFAAKRGRNVIIAEKNQRTGKKLLITGKGRCNITNNCSAEDFLKSVKTNSKFLFSCINAFTPDSTMSLFEQLNVKLKTERGNRVFPVSDKASDVVDALSNFAKSSGAKIIFSPVEKITANDGRITGAVLKNGDVVSCESVVIATGGKSYPLTGSTGDGYKFAAELGHTITEISPSLVPIVANEKWCSELMGLSLKNVTLKLLDIQKNKIIYDELGEMLFTHFGVSGPLVLSASSHMSGDLAKYRLRIDLKPALSIEKLDERILRDFDKYKNRDFINSLGDLLPKKLIPVIVKLSGINPDEKINQITREQRKTLAELIKNLEVTPKCFRPIDEAIITSGGVSVKEINPKTMESKLVKGLFFAGEVIDVDAYTGGFNLQIAFSTGYVAAQNV